LFYNLDPQAFKLDLVLVVGRGLLAIIGSIGGEKGQLRVRPLHHSATRSTPCLGLGLACEFYF